MEPKRLLILDAIGAVVSAVMLGVVLVYFNAHVGIPTQTLFFLAFIPCLFFVFDLYNILRTKNLKRPLVIIAVLNLCYCFLSLGFLFYHLDTITSLGLIYVIVEVLVILGIVILEFQAASKIQVDSLS